MSDVMRTLLKGSLKWQVLRTLSKAWLGPPNVTERVLWRLHFKVILRTLSDKSILGERPDVS